MASLADDYASLLNTTHDEVTALQGATAAFDVGFIHSCLAFLIVTIAASRLGGLFVPLGLPLITGYLFIGAIAGPYVLGVIKLNDLPKLDFVTQFALAFVAFSAGAGAASVARMGRWLAGSVVRVLHAAALVLRVCMLFGPVRASNLFLAGVRRGDGCSAAGWGRSLRAQPFGWCAMAGTQWPGPQGLSLLSQPLLSLYMTPHGTS